MENVNYLIIISINFGENFPINEVIRHFGQQSQTLVSIEARFNDTVLTSDPIEISTSSVDLKTELCFQVDRKQLHSFRIERKPIKLQSFLTDSSSDHRHYVGYVVLDLRNAKNYSTNPKYEWMTLLNPKYKGLSSKRPQMSIALMIHKLEDKEDNQTHDNQTDQTDKPLTSDSESHESMSSLKSDSSTSSVVERIDGELYKSIDETNVENDIKVRFKDGFHYIWDAKRHSEIDCKHKYLFSVTIAFADHLKKLFVSSDQIQSAKPFQFRYSFLGTTVKTNPFFDIDSCDFPIERTAFNLLTTDMKTLSVYFDLHKTIEIQFCDNSEVMFGLVAISLAKFGDASQTSFKPIEGSFMILPDNETLEVNEPFPIVGASIELRRDEFIETHIPTKETKSNHLNTPAKSSAKEPTIPKHKSPDRTAANESDLNHYCFAIDLRNIRVIDEDMSQINSCYLQFLYAFFGFTESIKTFPSIELRLNEDVIIPHGFCAFNFATTQFKLEKTFKEIPLVIEVIEESKINTIIGSAKVDLSAVLAVKPNKADAKQMTNILVPVVNEMDTKFAEVHVIMFLQNYGKTKIPIKPEVPETSVMSRDVRSVGHRSSDSIPNVDDLLIETALEIELWKEKQLILFNEKMKQKEIEFFNRLEEKQIDKEEEFKNRLKEVSELEKRLLASLEDLKDRENDLTIKESEVESKHQAINERYEKLDEEISHVMNDLKVKYEEKVDAEKERTKSCESEKSKYQERVYALERKVKEKENRIKELEDKVNELMNKSNAKNNVKTPTRNTSVKTLSRSVNGTTPKSVSVIREPSISSLKSNAKTVPKNPIFSKTSTTIKSNIKPVINETKNNSNRVMTTNTKLNGSRSSEKTQLIATIKQKRKELIDRGVALNDPLIKEIDSKLKGI